LSRYWCEFTFSGAVPPQDMILDAPELNFRRFLRERYGSAAANGTAGQPRSGTTPDKDAQALAALNASWKTSFRNFDGVPLPLAYADCMPARFEAASLRWSFATEPFERILEYILGRGRAAQNTVILVVLSLVAALTVNPLAAYSLSRFSMKQSHQVLIFFLATMAFPAEVAMIPNFLLLRDLGLLNSYAALVLPGMANGFAIFLLKCFFDSLPRELYEAAEIDGASEFQVFRLVALPILTPILAYIALATFVAAYGGFMWAFVICPKEDMWTLMVWVYDFQSRNTTVNYIMAATLLVGIPPLLVFLFANRIIMRGIMVPTMK
jgi:multiple sugar transport system permease protein